MPTTTTTTTPQPPPFRVLISGAGIAGPALTLALSLLLPPELKRALSITLVERHPTLRNNGQQIDLRGQGVDAMRALGIEAAVRARVVNEPGFRYLDWRGKQVAYFGSNKTGKGAQTFSAEWEIMRGGLVDVLYEATKGLDGVKYLFGTTVEGFEQTESGPVRARLSDGTEGEYDLLVGADGVGSRIRRRMFGDGRPDPLDPIGMSMALYTIPAAEGDTPDAAWCSLPGKRYYMTRRDREDCLRVYLGYAGHDEKLKEALRHGTMAERKEAWANVFRHDMHESWQVPRFLEGLYSPEADDFYTLEMAQVKLDTWSNGRVVVLGDAAFCPTPLTGMGTSLALAGAYVMAGEIARVCGEKVREEGANPWDAIPEALKAYEETIRPFVDHVQSMPVKRIVKYAIPESEWVIRLFHWIAWVIGLFRIDKLAARFATDDRGPWKLPKYPHLGRFNE
ncbi:hypothetical protein VTI74DRAFT_7159 [Chaetomium olivicolor]